MCSICFAVCNRLHVNVIMHSCRATGSPPLLHTCTAGWMDRVQDARGEAAAPNSWCGMTLDGSCSGVPCSGVPCSMQLSTGAWLGVVTTAGPEATQPLGLRKRGQVYVNERDRDRWYAQSDMTYACQYSMHAIVSAWYVYSVLPVCVDSDWHSLTGY